MACQKSSPTAEKISCQNIGVLSKRVQYCNDYILFEVTIEDSNGKRFILRASNFLKEHQGVTWL